MKTRKWHKFRASKAQFPTHQIDGTGSKKGSLVIGMKTAREHLEHKLGRSLKDAVAKGDSHNWIFKFPVGQVPARTPA